MPRGILVTGLLLLVGVPAPVSAKVVELANEGFTLEVPDDWVTTLTPSASAPSTPFLILKAGNVADTGLLNVFVSENPGNIPPEPTLFFDGVKSGISRTVESQGSTIQFTKTGDVTIGGIPGHYIEYMITTSDNRGIAARYYEFTANDKLYGMSVQTNDRRIVPLLAAMVTSLHFSAPPAPLRSPSNQLASRWGVVAGSLLGGLGGLAAIIFLLRRRARA